MPIRFRSGSGSIISAIMAAIVARTAEAKVCIAHNVINFDSVALWLSIAAATVANIPIAAPDTVAGHPVRKNDVILIAPWLLHRHEKLWRDPNAFIPSRFMPPASAPDRFAYLPFGVGARICIGAHFALVEATLALAKLIGAFRVTLLDKTPVIPVGVVTTQPDRSPMFLITRR